jgi:hypothetical protein
MDEEAVVFKETTEAGWEISPFTCMGKGLDV